MKPTFDDYFDAAILSVALTAFGNIVTLDAKTTCDIICKIAGMVIMPYCFCLGLIGVIRRRLKELSRQFTDVQQTKGCKPSEQNMQS